MAPRPHALSKTNRLRRKSEFLSLRKVSRKFSGRHWNAFFEKKAQGESRLGLSVSTRYGSAVSRNKFKRWTREWFRNHRKDMKIVDLHVVAKGKAPSQEREAKLLYRNRFNEDLEKLYQFLAK